MLPCSPPPEIVGQRKRERRTDFFFQRTMCSANRTERRYSDARSSAINDVGVTPNFSSRWFDHTPYGTCSVSPAKRSCVYDQLLEVWHILIWELGEPSKRSVYSRKQSEIDWMEAWRASTSKGKARMVALNTSTRLSACLFRRTSTNWWLPESPYGC